MPEIGSRSSHHVYKTARGSAKFRSHRGTGNPKLLDHFQANGHAVAAGCLVAIVYAVDGETVVPASQSSKGKTAVIGNTPDAGG